MISYEMEYDVSTNLGFYSDVGTAWQGGRSRITSSVRRSKEVIDANFIALIHNLCGLIYGADNDHRQHTRSSY